MDELIAKLEAASEPTIELFSDAYVARFGCRPVDELFQLDGERGTRFYRLLFAEAWLEAAKMLVPEGWWCWLSDADNGVDALCELSRQDGKGIGVRAKTWPLALCIAALKAQEDKRMTDLKDELSALYAAREAMAETLQWNQVADLDEQIDALEETLKAQEDKRQ